VEDWISMDLDTQRQPRAQRLAGLPRRRSHVTSAILVLILSYMVAPRLAFGLECIEFDGEVNERLPRLAFPQADTLPLGGVVVLEEVWDQADYELRRLDGPAIALQNLDLPLPGDAAAFQPAQSLEVGDQYRIFEVPDPGSGRPDDELGTFEATEVPALTSSPPALLDLRTRALHRPGICAYTERVIGVDIERGGAIHFLHEVSEDGEVFGVRDSVVASTDTTLTLTTWHEVVGFRLAALGEDGSFTGWSDVIEVSYPPPSCSLVSEHSRPPLLWVGLLFITARRSRERR
jgi:hypothetical protein